MIAIFTSPDLKEGFPSVGLLYVSRTGLPAEDVYAVVPFRGGDGGRAVPRMDAHGRVDNLLVHLVDDLTSGLELRTAPGELHYCSRSHWILNCGVG